MTNLSRQAKRSRAQSRGALGVRTPQPPPQRAARPTPNAAQPTPVERPAAQDPRPQGRRRPPHPSAVKPTRPVRPPRPKTPGLAAVRPGARGVQRGAEQIADPSRGITCEVPDLTRKAGAPVGSTHPLTDTATNARLADYERRVKDAFGRIVPTLKEIASHRCAPDFVARAGSIAQAQLGLALPEHLLDDAWVTGLDMRRLFAWVLFETYHRISDDFFTCDPLGGRDDPAFQRFLLECGFHLLDLTPCADGRLAHAISYVLRLPYGGVRRKSYAGTLFDIENTVEKWIETELRRHREGIPSPADAPTRYLKTVIYHHSSGDPHHQGCAAHGSDDATAARAAWERLEGFRQAIENGFCCGASVDLLLIGMDTDTDAIRVHVPDAEGRCDLHHWLDARAVYEDTVGMSTHHARARVLEQVRAHAPTGAGGGPAAGMVKLIARLIENNISQIDLVRQVYGGRYRDIGHAERFIGVGVGFEEIQLRNLTFFAYMNTVEEGAAHLDVGIKIFTGLNLAHGLPVPVVVRYDYHGGVPGARERAVQHCERLATALAARYPQLSAQGLLHCLRVVRDCDAAAPIEIVGSTLEAPPAGH